MPTIFVKVPDLRPNDPRVMRVYTAARQQPQSRSRVAANSNIWLLMRDEFFHEVFQWTEERRLHVFAPFDHAGAILRDAVEHRGFLRPTPLPTIGIHVVFPSDAEMVHFKLRFADDYEISLK